MSDKKLLVSIKKKNETLEMVSLYLQGTTPRRIGEIYNVSASSVGDRLKRMGYARPYRRLSISSTLDAIEAVVDKSRLETLYAKEQLSYDRIAAELNVSVRVVRKALEFYEMPKRVAPCWGGRYLGLLRRLPTGGSAEILYRDQNQIATLHQSAQALGINIVVKTVDKKLLVISKVSADEIRRLSDISHINRGRLVELYTYQNLSPAKIGQQLGFDAELIVQALDHYSIPRRKPGIYGGKYTDVFRKLKIGETSEVECTAKKPYHNLHSIAVRIGMKISMRKISDTNYLVTRLK